MVVYCRYTPLTLLNGDKLTRDLEIQTSGYCILLTVDIYSNDG